MDADVLKQEWEELEEGVKMLVARVEALQHRCSELEKENMSLQALLRSCKDSLKSLQKRGEMRTLVDEWVGGGSVEARGTAGDGGAVAEHTHSGKREKCIGLLDRHIASLERCIAFLKK